MLAVALAALLPVVAQADALYARRAEDPGSVDAAIALYRRVLADEPGAGESLAKLLRALHFKGAFAGAPPALRAAAFDEGRRLGQAFVDRIERGLPRRGGERIEALRRVPHAADVYFWTAACWGQWALTRGKLAAARQGVAGRLRDLAQTVIDLDPGLEEGGGDRILGRVHHQAPRIPFVTGWVSREKALLHLRRSYAVAPFNSATRFFLADAILDLQPRSKQEAIRLLQSCREDAPRPEYLVEDSFYAEEARRRLAAINQASSSTSVSLSPSWIAASRAERNRSLREMVFHSAVVGPGVEHLQSKHALDQHSNTRAFLRSPDAQPARHLLRNRERDSPP